MVELTRTKKELILVLPHIGQESFKIQNIIQCCLMKKDVMFTLNVFFQSKTDFPYHFKDRTLFKVTTSEYFTISLLRGKNTEK